jgi:hypothetical protein
MVYVLDQSIPRLLVLEQFDSLPWWFRRRRDLDRVDG